MKKIFLSFAAILLLTSCATTKITRMEPNTQTDLSGRWNDTDVKLVCRELIESSLSSPRVEQVRKSNGRTPTVIIGRFRNDSDEQIDTEIITSNFRTAIINSGRLDFVAGGSAREEIRAERQDQQMGNTSDATAALLGKETGADFMLTGSVKTMVDRLDNRTAKTYIVTAELTSITTNTIIWTDQKEIKKDIVRARNKF